MLEKVSSKSISRLRDGQVASRYPRATLDHVVLVIKSRHSEVIVDWVDLESGEWVHHSTSPLPDVTHWVENALVVELIHWSRRRVPETNVMFSDFIIETGILKHGIELIFCGKSECFSLASVVREPPGICRCFITVDFYREIPWHGFGLRESQPKSELCLGKVSLILRSVDPEFRIFAAGAGSPIPTVLRPELLSFIAAVKHKLQVLSVANQFISDLVGLDLGVMGTKLIVPTVESRRVVTSS